MYLDVRCSIGQWAPRRPRYSSAKMDSLKSALDPMSISQIQRLAYRGTKVHSLPARTRVGRWFGAGRVALELQNRGLEIVGLDASPLAAKAALIEA